MQVISPLSPVGISPVIFVTLLVGNGWSRTSVTVTAERPSEFPDISFQEETVLSSSETKER